MKKQSSLKKEKQPKMKLHEKWKKRKALQFLSRLDTIAREEILLAISKGMCFTLSHERKVRLYKSENKSIEFIFKKNANINYMDSALKTEVLLMMINILFAKSISYKDTESIDKLNILRHQIYYEDFDYVIIMRELKKIMNILKKNG